MTEKRRFDKFAKKRRKGRDYEKKKHIAKFQLNNIIKGKKKGFSISFPKKKKK